MQAAGGSTDDAGEAVAREAARSVRARAGMVQVSDDDNVKQDLSIDVYGRKGEGGWAGGGAKVKGGGGLHANGRWGKGSGLRRRTPDQRPHWTAHARRV